MSGDKDWLFRIYDMVEHIEKIQEKLSKASEEEFYNDSFLQAGIERYFEIIGEAARHIPKDAQARYDHVDWRQIIGMRHKIAHDYLELDAKVLWDVYTQNFFGLKQQLQEILEKEDQ